jgi:chromosome segregation ATPase
MTTTIDPDVLRALDPRRSYLPKSQRAATADGEAMQPVTERIAALVAGSLASLSIEDLRREIERRQYAAGQLQARRERLVEELAEIEAQLKAMGALHNITTSESQTRMPRAMDFPASGLIKGYS